MSELVDEAVRHTLPVEVRLSHRPVDTIEGIVVPLERRELDFLQEGTLRLDIEELIARRQSRKTKHSEGYI